MFGPKSSHSYHLCVQKKKCITILYHLCADKYDTFNMRVYVEIQLKKKSYKRKKYLTLRICLDGRFWRKGEGKDYFSFLN